LDTLTQEQLTGRSDDHLVELPGGHRLLPEAAEAFVKLQADAADAGFELSIASAYRSFDRQCAIFNAKASGARPVHDDAGSPLDVTALTEHQRLHAILRFSALPGTSRHHWGSDLDVYDAAAVPADYAVQLTPEEVEPGGPFDALHSWLDAQMAAGRSHGFYRPYAADRGGVAPERWHLSYAPVAIACATALTSDVITQALASADLEMSEAVLAELDALIARYVVVDEGWCPLA